MIYSTLNFQCLTSFSLSFLVVARKLSVLLLFHFLLQTFGAKKAVEDFCSRDKIRRKEEFNYFLTAGNLLLL